MTRARERIARVEAKRPRSVMTIEIRSIAPDDEAIAPEVATAIRMLLDKGRALAKG